MPGAEIEPAVLLVGAEVLRVEEVGPAALAAILAQVQASQFRQVEMVRVLEQVVLETLQALILANLRLGLLPEPGIVSQASWLQLEKR